MSIAETKLNLVQTIIESEDKTFIRKMFEYSRVLKNQMLNEKEDDIPEHIIDEIKLSIKELDSGNDAGTPHEVMLQKFRKDFPNLNI